MAANQTNEVVIEIVGEGVADVGIECNSPSRPSTGVIPIMVNHLCGRPDSLRVKTRRFAHLQGRSLDKKIEFQKRQAKINGSAGIAVTLDSDGDYQARYEEMETGANSVDPDYPSVIGCPHPCIEAWLLSDATALNNAIEQCNLAQLPENLEPEMTAESTASELKRALATCCNENRNDVKAEMKWAIAERMRHYDRLRTKCPISFPPFADAVQTRLRPLFERVDK